MIKAIMDQAAQQDQSNNLQPPSAIGAGLSKEIETGKPAVEAPGLREVGQEVEIPPEAAGAGVRVQPTTVAVPPKAAQMGVTPVGQKVIPPAPAVPLPLTDDQIAQGLKQSISSSWRWLAEWCRRRLKQLHLTIKKIGGQNIEVKI